MIKLFVGGFPLDYMEVDLAKLLLPFGDISTIKIVCDKFSKKCKGYAFVEMINDNSALQAIKELNHTALSGKVLSLNIVEDKSLTAALPVQKELAAPVKTYAKVSLSPVNESPTKVLRPRRNRI